MFTVRHNPITHLWDVVHTASGDTINSWKDYSKADLVAADAEDGYMHLPDGTILPPICSESD